MHKLVGSLAFGSCWLVACGGQGADHVESAPTVGAAGDGSSGAFVAPSKQPPQSPAAASTSPLAPGTCLSLASSSDAKVRIATIALDTGTVTLGATVQLEGTELESIDSLGLSNDELYACTSAEGSTSDTLHTIDRRSGAIVATGVPCSAVTTDESGLWLRAGLVGGVLSKYPDVASARSGKAASTVTVQHVESLGPGKDTLYGAWHSDAKVLRIDRVSGAVTETMLEGFDGWIFGVSSASGGRLVVSSPAALAGEGVLLVFDGKTGKRIGRVGAAEPGTTFHGVVCSDSGERAPATTLPSEPR